MRLVIQRAGLLKALRPSSSTSFVSRFSTDKKELTSEQKDELRQELHKFKVEHDVPMKKAESFVSLSSADVAMDEIRARGFLQYKYSYTPVENVKQIVDEIAEEFGLTSKENAGKISDLDTKAHFLIKLGTRLRHFVPTSQLHYIQCIDDVKEFYSKPVQNLTEYAKLARNEEVPENLAVREHPARFHPNDYDAPHRGVTAFPGSGGKVLGIRSKRLYRQFRPKQEWFDYEEQTFDHEVIDEGMPWDTKIAEKMDRYVDRKFKKDGFYKLR